MLGPGERNVARRVVQTVGRLDAPQANHRPRPCSLDIGGPVNQAVIQPHFAVIGFASPARQQLGGHLHGRDQTPGRIEADFTEILADLVVALAEEVVVGRGHQRQAKPKPCNWKSPSSRSSACADAVSPATASSRPARCSTAVLANLEHTHIRSHLARLDVTNGTGCGCHPGQHLLW
jgi:hypothetical protein